MKEKQQYLIVGLGGFGKNLALSLVELGAEVMGVDLDEQAVAAVADKVTHTGVADTTDSRVVQQLGVGDFDAVVCAIGTHLEASLMTTLLLKENGAKKLVAKAANEMHGKILSRIGAETVLYPEKEVANRLAKDFMASKDFVELVPLTVQHSMFEVAAPKKFCGHTLQELHMRRNFGLNVIALKRAGETIVSPAADEVVRHKDLMIVVGDKEKAQKAIDKFEPPTN
ncbi:MAG: TrkA family potassium uptake protein [Candidatus Eremiobacteraeota bacterium]|nr:TrkA family potassium uptake protein [Candidatus Eremiobacteraeota bacterium]